MQVVQRCPDNLQTWKEAAKRKNCSAYASQCSEPDRLAYHCVLNPYANETLEVCAYVQNIVLGRTFLYVQYNLLKIVLSDLVEKKPFNGK